MRYLALFLMLTSLALFGFGCGQADQPSADPSPAATVDAPGDPDAPEPPAGEPAAEGEAEGEKAEESSSE